MLVRAEQERCDGERVLRWLKFGTIHYNSNKFTVEHRHTLERVGKTIFEVVFLFCEFLIHLALILSGSSLEENLLDFYHFAE